MLAFKSSIYIEKLKSSDIGRRMMSGAFWTFTGTAMSKAIVLIAGIFCARFLGQEEYGEFGLVRSTINMFVILGSAGLGLTATKYISEYKNNNPTKVLHIYTLTTGFALCAAFLISIVVLSLSSYLANITLNAPHLGVSIRIGAVLLFVTVLNAAQNGVLSGFESFRSIAINTFVAGIAESAFMLIGAHYYGLNGAVCGYGIGFAVLYICNEFAIKKLFIKHNIKRKILSLRELDYTILAKFTLPAALSSVTCVPVFWLIRTMLARVSDFSELALYEVADQWKTIILFIPVAISRIVLPILSSISSDVSNQYKFWRILKANILLNVSVSTLLTTVICIFSNQIMNLYGNGYDNIYPLVLLSISAIFTSIANVVGQAISSRAKMWVGFAFNVFWSILVLLCALFFLRAGLGATALSLALLVSYFIHSILQLIYLKHIVR